jgi:hypothetical protein
MSGPVYQGPLTRYGDLPAAKLWQAWLRARYKSRRPPVIGGKVIALALACYGDSMAWPLTEDIADYFGCTQTSVNSQVGLNVRRGLLSWRGEPLYVSRLWSPVTIRYLEPSSEVRKEKFDGV